MRSLSLLLVFFSGLSQAAFPQTTISTRITEYGVYRAEVVKRTVDSATATGTFSTVTNVQLVSQTTEVPAVLGTRFGYRYTVLGGPTDSVVTLKRVTRFPAQGLKNPQTGTLWYMNEGTLTRRVGSTYWTGYTFDNEWERVPGVWTFELWEGDRKILSQSFTVVAR